MTSAFHHLETAKDCHFSFSYKGPLSDGLTTLLLDMSQSTQEIDLKTSRKVSFLLVECFQNVVRHSEKPELDNHGLSRDGFFHFKMVENAFVINSINLIRNENIPYLEQKVKLVNSLEKSELRAKFKEMLQHEKFNEKGGAGLGLFEIARKSGRKIHYQIDKYTDEYSLFHQQITFVLDDTKAKKEYDFICDTKDVFTKMENEGLLLEYKGDISQRTVLPLLEIVNSGFQFKGSGHMRKAGHALIEMLQNISKHGSEQDERTPGVFIFGGKEDQVLIKTGNYISTEAGLFLNKEIEFLNALDEEEIRDHYRERMLLSIDLEDKYQSGLGLIEIAKSCSSKMKYIIEEIDHSIKFFSLQIEVQ